MNSSLATPAVKLNDEEWVRRLDQTMDELDAANAQVVSIQRRLAQQILQWDPPRSKLIRWADHRGIAIATVEGWIALERQLPAGTNAKLGLGSIKRVLEIEVPDDPDEAERAEEARRELLTGEYRTEQQMAQAARAKRIELGQLLAPEPATPTRGSDPARDRTRSAAAARYEDVAGKILTSGSKGRFYVTNKEVIFDVIGQVGKDGFEITVKLYDENGPVALNGEPVVAMHPANDNIATIMFALPEPEAD